MHFKIETISALPTNISYRKLRLRADRKSGVPVRQPPARCATPFTGLSWQGSLTWLSPCCSISGRTTGRKVWGSNPIRVKWDFSALAGSYPELGVLWAQWEGWNHTAELHPLHGCVFEGVALITWPTLQMPQFQGLVNSGIIMTVSVVCGPVK